MRYMIVAASLAIAALVNVCALKAHAEGNPVTEPLTYRVVVKACGADWKASDARKSVEKGHGREAWQAFRAECVKAKGYEVKRRPRPVAPTQG